jgi:excinuclease ABC subunit A
VIDLGPEAGDAGGMVVVEGTPEEIVGTPLSHTAAALASVLAAGPHEERPTYDPNAAEAARDGDVPLEAVGQDARMPWQTDGPRWHTHDRVTSEGKPCRWEGKALEWVEERAHEMGDFGDTNWNHRSTVEIAGPNRSQGWFLHAMTGQEWLLRLVFRVGKNAFKQADLVARLGIRPLNETPGLEVYGSDDRVWVTKHKGPWESVTVMVHRLAEIDTPAFRKFLEEAARSFGQNLQRLRTKPEDVMPWRVNGERWHLGDKGFPPGRKVHWDRALLPRLLELVREVEPRAEVRWDVQYFITLRVPGVNRWWGQWQTKRADGLDCRFLGKKGQFNLSQVEGLGATAEIGHHRGDGDVLRLVFRHADQVQAARLKELLRQHLEGFREAFGNRPDDHVSE